MFCLHTLLRRDPRNVEQLKTAADVTAILPEAEICSRSIYPANDRTLHLPAVGLKVCEKKLVSKSQKGLQPLLEIRCDI